jgi:predicted RNase H-like HicB family nuclease
MTEIIFLVESDSEGGYVARAIGESIFTQADSIQELRNLVKDAIHCHYPDKSIRPIMRSYCGWHRSNCHITSPKG